MFKARQVATVCEEAVYVLRDEIVGLLAEAIELRDYSGKLLVNR
jgi:hypothetical protein